MLPYLLSAVFVIFACRVMYGFWFSNTAKVSLTNSAFKPFKLIEKITVNHNSFIFRFALDSPTHTLGLPVGKHIYIRALCTTADGKQETVQHPYTPISSDDEKGHVDFLIKVYFKNTHPKFPDGGRLSQHLYHLPIGRAVDLRGPVGPFTYSGGGRFAIERRGAGAAGAARRGRVSALALVAGGTGLTPLLQVLRAVLKDPADRTAVALVYANRTPADILLREELDQCAADPRVRVWYTVSEDAPEDWRYGVGHVDEEMLRAHLPAPGRGERGGDGEETLALICGPPMMLQRAVKPNLEKIGYAKEDIFVF